MNKNHFAVATTVKNEGPFIIDWVAHYQALGFDHLIVASNDCTDLTDPILRRLQRMGIIRHHETIVRHAGIQRSAIRQTLEHYDHIRESEWVFICDIDEYLNIHVGSGSVRDLVQHTADDETDAIAIPWRLFSSDGIEEFSDDPVTEIFTKGEMPYHDKLRPNVGKFTKSLIRNREKFQRMGLHFPIASRDEDAPPTKIVIPNGMPYIINGEFQRPRMTFEVAQVNHYATKSLESFLIKCARGRANHNTHKLGFDYWDRHNRTSITDLSIARYDEAKAQYREAMLADKKLAKLQLDAVIWHITEAHALINSPENAKLVALLRKHNQPKRRMMLLDNVRAS